MAEIKTNIWDVKYRPKTFDEYISSNKSVIHKFKEYVQTQDVSNILLHGPAGTGKTSLVKILLSQLDADILSINASDENNVETIRTKIKGFVTTGSFKKFKVVNLEEADQLTFSAQSILRDMIERYFDHCRFVITCNYYDKIEPAIKSRFAKGTFQINSPDKKDIAKFIENILKTEQIEYNIKDVAKIINKYHPDIRSIIGTTQLNVINGKLELNEDNFTGINYLEEIFEILKDKKIDKNNSYVKIRQVLADARLSDYQPVFKYFYTRVNELTTSISSQANIDYILAETQKDVMSVVDKEINMMSGFNRIISELKS